MDSMETINGIIQRYQTEDELLTSNSYGDGGLEPLFPRLERAAMNQDDDGEATLSRYAIWANTVRDRIAYAIKLMEQGEIEESKRILTGSHNSLSAFSEIQALYDPLER